MNEEANKKQVAYKSILQLLKNKRDTIEWRAALGKDVLMYLGTDRAETYGKGKMLDLVGQLNCELPEDCHTNSRTLYNAADIFNTYSEEDMKRFAGLSQSHLKAACRVDDGEARGAILERASAERWPVKRVEAGRIFFLPVERERGLGLVRNLEQ